MSKINTTVTANNDAAELARYRAITAERKANLAKARAARGAKGPLASPAIAPAPSAAAQSHGFGSLLGALVTAPIVKAAPVVAEPAPVSITADGVVGAFRFVTFDGIPPREVRDAMKASGWVAGKSSTHAYFWVIDVT